jgi:hypothetical protein
MKRPSIPVPKRAQAERTGRSVPPPADLAKRVSQCEAEIRALRAELAALRAELPRSRKLPPPLPTESSDEIIAVDPSEVVLESIRPPGPRRRT